MLTECALPGWMSNCNGAINTAQAYINNTLPTQLSNLYAAIRTRAPYAKVVVVGYPRIFQGEDCNALTWFSPDEESRLNQTADLLNSRTASVAAARGFTFANPTTASSATRSATTWSGSTASPTRSRRATTPTCWATRRLHARGEHRGRHPAGRDRVGAGRLRCVG